MLSLVALLVVTAQTPAPPPPTCDSILTGLAAKAEADYAGFVLEYRGKRLNEYRTRLAALHQRALTTAGDACFFVLHAYTDAFHDPHLFVFQNGYRDTIAVAAALSQRVAERSSITETEARRRFEGGKAMVDPIEGIWTDGTLRVAVVPEGAGSPGQLIAVVLTSDTVLWQPGEIRARFVRDREGLYQGQLQERNLARRFVSATIYKRNLLRFDPGMWAREFPVDPADSGLVSTAEPHDATLTWRGLTPVLSIPSHDPDHRSRLNALIGANAAAIRQAPRFIVDLRGNEGGASWVTDSLLPLIAGPLRTHQPERLQDGRMLSSPDQIKYVQDRPFNISSDSLTIVHLIERMTAHPGALVTLQDSSDQARTGSAGTKQVTPFDSTTGPLTGMLIDGGTVSASEVLVLDALRYARVTVFGQHTAGALDYQSVSIVRIGDSARRWYLGYPTITASPLLPKGGMRGKGIAPDRKVDWGTITDPIGFVDQALGAR